MSLVSGRTFGLDKRGSRIWALLEQPQSVSALVASLVAQYEITPGQCQADLIGFLDTMVAADLAIFTNSGDQTNAPTA